MSYDMEQKVLNFFGITQSRVSKLVLTMLPGELPELEVSSVVFDDSKKPTEKVDKIEGYVWVKTDIKQIIMAQFYKYETKTKMPHDQDVRAKYKNDLFFKTIVDDMVKAVKGNI